MKNLLGGAPSENPLNPIRDGGPARTAMPLSTTTFGGSRRTDAAGGGRCPYRLLLLAGRKVLGRATPVERSARRRP